MWYKIDFERHSSAYMDEKHRELNRKIPNCDKQFLDFINKYSSKISDFRLFDRPTKGNSYNFECLTLFYESKKELERIKYE